MRRTSMQIPARFLMLGLCLTLAVPGHAIGHKKKKKATDLSAPTADASSKQPDKELYDKAMNALKKGRYDVARLDLQTMLNTYPDSEFSMRAKLAVGDTWYKEGGTAAMAQAEQEYKDFETFFPNTPEAAEAQMKVGDIYFAQMDKPDRDAQNVIHAEQEYRQMIQQYPDSTLVPRAKQRLREVQEVLAARQFEVGQFYIGRENWSAAIARLQTVADAYPLFSHSDQTLISIGDAYAAEAQLANTLRINPRAKEELVAAYNDRAAAAWDRVVTRYAMSPHVEDAKDRLIAMGRPVPEPSSAQMAESEAEEGSRATIKIKDRTLALLQHGPSTIESARVGEPTMTDPAPVLAPNVTAETLSNFNLAIKGQPIPPIPAEPSSDAAAIAAGTAPPRTGQPAPAITMDNVPSSGGGGSIGAEIVSAPNSAPASTAPATGTPAAGSPATDTIVPTPPSGSAVGAPATPAATGNSLAPRANPENVYGLAAPVGPTVAPTLPPVDKPAAAADQINDVKAGGPAQVTTGTTAGKKKKNPKPAYNSKDESSSKHKPKKGIDKINPL